MKRVPPWRWNIWGPWPPEDLNTSEEEIRKLAHILSKQYPSRSADENWTKARNELAEPLPWSSFVRWLGFSDKKGWDWLDFLSRLSVPIIIAFGGWYLSSQATIRQQKIAYYQRDYDIISDYMKEVKSLLLDKDRNIITLNQTQRRLVRNLTLTALKQVYDPGSRTLIARFLVCGSDVEPITITPPISWSSVDLRNTDLKGCTLTNTDLRWADLQGSDLRGQDTNLTDSLLSMSVLKGADLRGSVMVRANLYNAILQDAVLEGANLSGADLSMADLSHAVLKKTLLTKANLGSTRKPSGPKNKRGAILNGASLAEAILIDADLRDADLRDADLTDADLTGSHLEGADFRNAHLRGAIMRGVKWDKRTLWPKRAGIKDAKDIPEQLRIQLGI